MNKDLIDDISTLVVNTNSLFEVDDTFNDERFMRVKISAMHDGINRNNSRFSTEVIKNAKDTFANIPVLADVKVYTDKDGKEYLDYSGHSMHIEQDAFDENNNKVIYDERVVGIIPESNNFELVYDKETQNNYVLVDALLFRDYGNYVCDILESRGGKTDVSMEIACDDVSYDAKEKCLNVGKMTACGLTMLGSNVQPGMAKAHAEMFSLSNDDKQTQLIKIMQELKESLDNYNKNFGKEEQLVEENKELFEDVAETEEVVEEETVEETVEEVATEEETTEETTEEETTTEEEFSENTEDVTPEETSEKAETEEVEVEEVVEQNSLKYSISYGKEVKEFAVSLSDIMCALNELVNETYADENSYYGVEVYAEDSYVIMVDYMTGKAYKQNYKCKRKHSYSLVGDRVPVKAMYVTEDEEKQLESMRSNYSALVEFKENTEKAELHSQREQVLANEKYSVLSDNKKFAKLIEDMDNYSLDELEKEAKVIFAEYALEGGTVEFAQAPQSKVKIFASSTKKNGRYGDIFSK